MVHRQGSSKQEKQGYYHYIVDLYNIAQTIGWGYVFVMCIMILIWGDISNTYTQLSSLVYVIQLAAFFEVFNSVVGFTRSDPFAAFLQWFGRIHCLAVVLCNAPANSVQDHGSVWLLFLAWSGIEVVRYPLYLLHSSATLSWLRYTLFIPLYPLGVLGELAIIKRSVPHFRETGMFSVSLPNAINWSFRYDLFLLFGLYTLYPILFPRMYIHMFKQRSKKLGGHSNKNTKRD
eukprot:gb/GECH01010886.1/.p1 GENE.gb/GECH01010886.1/~~gb/GECH01010886.1/.p1  ORF type:complete len:232 (+),score=29.87 gb/GECH01010886.1/:1-696(+)